MRIVTIPTKVARGRYQREVVEHGHLPGYLSGTSLTKAAKAAGEKQYRQSRANLAMRLVEHGIVPAYFPRRNNALLWADYMTGFPVQLKLENGDTQ